MEEPKSQGRRVDTRSRRKNNQKAPKKGFDILLNIIIVILVIATALMLVYRFSTSEAKVIGHSMDNTLTNDENIVYEKITGAVGDYKKGDILILKEDAVKKIGEDQGGQIVKRLIAQGGDTVSFSEDGKPIINGKQNEETYIKEQNTVKISDFATVIRRTNEKYKTNFDETSTVIPAGYYFVMGDNRNNSSDSRVFGLFQKNDILGRAVYSKTYNRFY